MNKKHHPLRGSKPPFASEKSIRSFLLSGFRLVRAKSTGAGAFLLVLITAFSALPQIAFAGDISGRVVDANTGNFVPGVSVTLSEVGRVAVTDRSGTFTFSGLEAGTYTLLADFIGYDTVTSSVNVPAEGRIFPRLTIGEEKLELEEFVVEGLREGRSLALQQKRTAPSIRDIISSDSIGNLPDRNVAEALVRLPGISIDLDQGEGRFVSIRGIEPNLNNVTVNGATVANPGVSGRQGRAMPLDVIGSAQVQQIEVIKAATPDMDAQGLGGTVNITTPSGFDKEKPFLYGGVSAGTNDMADSAQYKFNGTYGAQLGADKKLAIAVSGNYEWRPFTTDHIDIRRSFFDADVDGDGVTESSVFIPFDLEIVPDDGNRQRIGTTLKAQYRPDAETEIRFDFIYNRFKQWLTHIEDKVEPDGDAFFTSPTTGFFDEINSREIRLQHQRKDQELLNLVFAVDKKWGNLKISPEITYSFAQEEDVFNSQTQYRGRNKNGQYRYTDADAAAGRIFDSPIPGVSFGVGDSVPVFFDLAPLENRLFIQEDIASDTSRLPHRRNRIDDSIVEEKTWIPKLDLQWDTDNFLGSGHPGFFKTGFKFFNRDRFVDDNSFRPVAKGTTLADIPNSTIPAQDVLSYSGASRGGFDLNYGPIVQDFFGGLTTPQGFIDRGFSVDFAESAENGVEDDFNITEKIYAAFFMGSVDVGEKLNIMAGFRWEKTNVDLAANQFSNIGKAVNPDAVDLSNCVDSKAGDFCIEETGAQFNFSNWLPNVQMRYKIQDNLIFRFAYSNTVGRPAFDDAAPISQWEPEDIETDRVDEAGNPLPDLVGRATIRLRNPQLQPYESRNFDISLEYYTKNGGLFSVALFRKDIDNPIFEFGFDDRNWNLNLEDTKAELLKLTGSTINPLGLTGTEVIKRLRLKRGQQNADTGFIKGVELNAQVPFTFLPAPFDGFGIDLNATFIDSGVTFLPIILEKQPGREKQDFPFFKQPDWIGNAAIWYQKGKWSTRVAVRFQAKQVDSLEGIPEQDPYSAQQTFWDAQVRYRLNDHWSMTANFQNFTNEFDDRSEGGDSSRLKDRENFGRTFLFGLNFNY